MIINSLKGIISGILFIIISMLLLQLISLLLSVVYNHFANDLTFLKNIKWIFKYLLGFPTFVSIMFMGGYITTHIAKKKSVINGVIVGGVVMVSMMWSALANAELTTTGLVVSFAVIVVIVLGGASASKKLP